MLLSKIRYEELVGKEAQLQNAIDKAELLRKALILKLHEAESDPFLDTIRSLHDDELIEMESILLEIAKGDSTHKSCASLSLSLLKTIKEQKWLTTLDSKNSE